MQTMIVTLTTDFGVGSPYVAAMKGVLLSINPAVQIVDLTHTIPPQDIRAGAQALAQAAPLFPPDTIHVAVVDPGVGTQRKILYARIGSQQYVCPDNGLLDRLAARESPSMMVEITNGRFFRHPVAPTFHGRDIMAPVAAQLSLGAEPNQLGPPLRVLQTLDWPAVEIMSQCVRGEITAIDSFGNLITNITREMLAGVPSDDSVVVHCDGHETSGIFTTYGDQPPLTLVAVISSNDLLEIAIVDDSAAIMLGVGVGIPVEVAW